MSLTLARERRSWTPKEDQLLRDAVQKEDPENANPSKWHAIAKHVPNRTNKDCRKRWFAKMANDVVKGGWSPQEDEKLVKGIERYGTRWSLVASVVQSRNSDQCAKRWTDTLNPAIDRTTWTPEADDLLLQAVAEHGKVWTKIVKTYFPGRTGLSAKNRYNSITRFNSDASRTRRRKSTDVSFQPVPRKTRSISSSSSVSPALTHVSLPFPSSSFNNNHHNHHHHQSIDVKSQFQQMEPYSWSSSSSASIEEMTSFRASPIAIDYPQTATSRSSPSINEPSYHAQTPSAKHQLSSFRFPNSFDEPVNSFSPHQQPSAAANSQYRQFTSSSQQAASSSGSCSSSSADFHAFPQIPLVQVHPYNDVSSQLALFDSHTLDTNPSMSAVGWEGALSTAESKALGRSPLSTYSYV